MSRGADGGDSSAYLLVGLHDFLGWQVSMRTLNMVKRRIEIQVQLKLKMILTDFSRCNSLSRFSATPSTARSHWPVRRTFLVIWSWAIAPESVPPRERKWSSGTGACVCDWCTTGASCVISWIGIVVWIVCLSMAVPGSAAESEGWDGQTTYSLSR